MYSHLLALLGCLHFGAVVANTEKVIFQGPPSLQIPDARPNLYDLNLEVLTHENSKLKTSLAVAFPTEDQPRGLESWYLVKDLTPSKRYEARVCWAANEPTEFQLQTYSLSKVFNTPELVSGLATYAENRKAIPRRPTDTAEAQSKKGPGESTSLVFLRVFAAASFVTTNETLMSNPPDVAVELILDPYAANVLPDSLKATAVYVLLLAGFGWFFSGFVWKWLLQLSQKPKPRKRKQK